MLETAKKTRPKVPLLAAVLLAGVLATPTATAHTNPVATLPDTVSTWSPYREFDIKTNLIHDATQSISLGVEFGLSRRWSLDLSGAYNGWNLAGDHKWKHWLVQPEARFWLKRTFGGHFFGIHALGGEYNIGHARLPFNAFPSTDDNRYEGWGAGAGLLYGYRWNFSERWGMEGVIGAGYIYTEYDRYACGTCGEKLGSDTHHYIGPTKVALNLVYRFGAKKRNEARRRQAAAPQIVQERIVRDTVVIHETKIVHDTVFIEKTPPRTAVRSEKYTLWLHYRAGSPVLLRNFDDNESQLCGLAAFVDRMRQDTTIVIQAIRISGYCSIEGTAELNNRLSYGRANGIADFLRHEYPMLGEVLSVQGFGEDWEGLLRLVEKAYGLESKERIERIITNVGVYEGRERQLMELDGGRPYRWMLSEFFPKLRRTEVTIDYTKKTFVE